MANREKGEIRLDAGGKVYRLVLNTNAMAVAEAAISTPDQDVFWDDLWAKATAGSVRHLRALLFGMLQKFHSNLTLEDVGGLVDEIGGLVGLAHVLKNAADAASPDPDDMKALPKPEAEQARPRTAQGGTGARSTATPAVSA